MQPIVPISDQITHIGELRDGAPSGAPRVHDGTVGFVDMLKDAVGNANQAAQTAQAAGEAFATGARDDIHGTMLALSKADIELRLVGAIRNKVVDAFYELWRMQI